MLKLDVLKWHQHSITIKISTYLKEQPTAANRLEGTGLKEAGHCCTFVPGILRDGIRRSCGRHSLTSGTAESTILQPRGQPRLHSLEARPLGGVGRQARRQQRVQGGWKVGGQLELVVEGGHVQHDAGVGEARPGECAGDHLVEQHAKAVGIGRLGGG